jgi:site-specific recombinase XerD
MITDFKTLLRLCDDELHQREYNMDHYRSLKKEWDELAKWMSDRNYSEFNQEIGYIYCKEAFGGHLIQKNMNKPTKVRLRAIRMLISYQKDGCFEFRTPSVERIFKGTLGELMLDYLRLCEYDLELSPRTVEGKRLYLYEFNSYLEIKQYSLDDLNTDRIEEFFQYKEYSLPSRHNASRNIKLFLRYAFDVEATSNDQSIYVLKDNYKKQSKLPTIYEESEIKAIIEAVERSSAIGKRDYLILLLAAEYGWRSSDITHFRFDYIDWDKNMIQFNQKKTDSPVEYPLLASIGNAIIDYTKNGRPSTDVPEIIVSAESSKKGLPLSPPTIHSIVTKYMRKAGTRNWQNKKHGAHSLRHSLATNMLKKNVSMPIISTVMGHQSTETTNVYLSVDTAKLRQCVLPMPPIHSQHYRNGVKS